jgi:hypothetical protein
MEIMTSIKVFVGSVGEGVIDSLLADGGTINIRNAVKLDNLVLKNIRATLIATDIFVENDFSLDNTQLTLSLQTPLAVGGRVELLNETVLTVPDADETTHRVLALRIDSMGSFTIDSQSQINLDGKGYPSNMNGPGLESEDLGCYGGLSSSAKSTCVYGDFRQVSLAGAGNTDAAGGGVISLKADTLEVNGVIRANGASGYRAGAGGGIHIEATVFNGTGTMTANAGVSSRRDYASGGGRVSLYVADGDFLEDNVSAAAVDEEGGAGTIFRQSADDAGYLVIDNKGVLSPDNGTVIRHVGLQNIKAVSSPSDGTWDIRVAGIPWQAKTTTRLGLVGLHVRLGGDENAPLYQITHNTENTITLEAETDLTYMLGKTLRGVITLQSLTIKGGASVDLGGDQLEQLDNL